MLSHTSFSLWLEQYGAASRENDPRLSAALFTPDAAYYETPFSEPILGEDAIYQYWLQGAQNLVEKSTDYEVLAIQGNVGIARWRSQFTSLKSGTRFHLDCVFVARFAAPGKCQEFREWWHIQERI
jgi:hypothetical protein